MLNENDEILDEEIFAEQEYLDDQCPNCFVVFETDEELLSHICSRYAP